MRDLRDVLLADTPWQGDEEPDIAAIAPALAMRLREFATDGLAAVVAVDEPHGLTAGFQKYHDLCRDDALAAAARLETVARDIVEVVEELRALFLTATNPKLRDFKGRKVTKAERQEAFAAAARPVLELLALPGLLDLLRNNETMLACGLRAIDIHAQLKRRDRVVDFQDLEELALRLLTDDEVGPGIHYRLDARLDHLLLDEFQDTNRNQWDLLAPLLDEVLAGGDRHRSAFVVGDVKQSIYGFRGADPTVFTAAKRRFESQVGGDAILRLPTNFRSLPWLVQTIGDLWHHDPLAEYLGEEVAGVRQLAARTVAPGKVVFVEPIDRDGTSSGHDRAAATVVALVQHLFEPGRETWAWNAALGRDEPRDLRHDDILILARTKTHLATYEAALRRAGIPFVPAGRGLLARTREVQDLLALLRWLSYPADDAAGATVLRSPCFRVSEDKVQTLLRWRLDGRRRSLREVLRDRGTELDLDVEREQLDRWFGAVGRRSLHDLLRRAIDDGSLFERFEIAGGEQARFNLARLLDLALAVDQRSGSLRDLVRDLEQSDRLGGDEEGALPGEVGAGRVRVMTVHGSKGLEAPVVILADAAVPIRERLDHLRVGEGAIDGPWAHDVSRGLASGPTMPGGASLKGPLFADWSRERSRMLGEEAHILYVALTRARDRLYVLGGRNDRTSGGQAGGGFLDWIAQADHPGTDRDRRWTGCEELLVDLAPSGEEADLPPTPAVERASRAEQVRSRIEVWTPPVLTPRFDQWKPSELGRHSDHDAGTPRAVDQRDTDATTRGTRIHRWLERACILGRMPALPGSRSEDNVEWGEARSVYEDDRLAWVFHSERFGGRGFSEIPLLHRLDDGPRESRVVGTVDRLVVRPDRIDVVDYKSNRISPTEVGAACELYRDQLGAYRDAIAVMYPDRTVRCWLLWTWLVAQGDGDGLTEVLA